MHAINIWLHTAQLLAVILFVHVRATYPHLIFICVVKLSPSSSDTGKCISMA